MIYALVIDGTIQRTSRTPRFKVSGRLGKMVAGDPDDIDGLHAAGWWEVTEVTRPDDTPTHTTDMTVELVDGTPTMAWVPRSWSPDEAAMIMAGDNAGILRQGLPAIIDRARARQASMTAILDEQNSIINSNPAEYIKRIARAERRTQADLMRLARLVGDLTDSADVGDET
jgi:hypothetical protein